MQLLYRLQSVCELHLETKLGPSFRLLFTLASEIVTQSYRQLPRPFAALIANRQSDAIIQSIGTRSCTHRIALKHRNNQLAPHPTRLLDLFNALIPLLCIPHTSQAIAQRMNPDRPVTLLYIEIGIQSTGIQHQLLDVLMYLFVAG